MIDLEHKAAMDRYLFAPKGSKQKRLVELQQLVKRLLKPMKKRKRAG